MKTYTISVNKNKCLGCGACTNISKNFRLDKEGKATVKKKEISEKELPENKQAQNICPVGAIIIK